MHHAVSQLAMESKRAATTRLITVFLDIQYILHILGLSQEYHTAMSVV